MAKFVKRRAGELVEVGDLIVVEHLGGTKSKYKVTRVTAKYCYIRHNELSESKYQRTVSEYGLREVPRPEWGHNSYYVYRPISETANA